MLAEALLLWSVRLAAVIEWVPATAGGVYTPAVVIEPTVELPPAIESTAQETPRRLGSLATCAVNCCFCVLITTAESFGVTVMVIVGTVTVMFALADLLASPPEAAVKVMVAGVGTVAGAV